MNRLQGVVDIARVPSWVGAAISWLLFGLLLLWGWRTTDLAHSVPSYGDALEGLWATHWYAEALANQQSPAWYPLAYHPAGWYVFTYAWGPANFLFLLPLHWLGGAAFAYNAATLLSLAIAFGGSLLLSRRFMPWFGATVAALLYTFWGLRWYGTVGQLNISLASAFLPWLIWSLEKGFASSRRDWAWYLLAGFLWAAGISTSLYFVWLDGVAVLCWLVARHVGTGQGALALFRRAAWVTVPAVVLSMPAILSFAQASAAAAAYQFTILDVNVLGANANSLPLPSPQHPFLGGIVSHLYQGPRENEISQASLGTLALVVALIGMGAAWRDKRWRWIFVTGLVGVVLSLGLTLHWNDHLVQTPLLRPVNQALWWVGYHLKPQFFMYPEAPEAFLNAVPLPGLPAAAVLPLFERGRVLARYALLAGMAVFMFAGIGLSRIRWRWLQVGLAALLIFEVLPPPTQSYAFPPPSHPAYAWLRAQTDSASGLAEFATDGERKLILPLGGDVIWATRDHGRPTIVGASSIWPGHTVYLMRWLSEHPDAFADSEFGPLLRFFETRYVLLHMYGGWQEDALRQAQENSDLRFVQCFDPASLSQPFDHRICIFEVLPPSAPSLNVWFREGWSGPESWGRWIDGVTARALWVAPVNSSYHLHFEAFPACAPDEHQTVEIRVNQISILRHQWEDCTPWSGDAVVPASAVNIGENEISIEAGYSQRPSDVSQGANPDTRALSLGVTQLRLERIP